MAVEHTGRNGERPQGREFPRHEVNRGWYWLLLLPLLGTLIPPIYNSADPKVIGIPFFYWYQMVWIPISVACTVLVYRRSRGGRR